MNGDWKRFQHCKWYWELLEPYDTELNIELKTYIESYEGLEERVNEIVNEFGNGRKIVYSSFHLPTLMKM